MEDIILTQEEREEILEKRKLQRSAEQLAKEKIEQEIKELIDSINKAVNRDLEKAERKATITLQMWDEISKVDTDSLFTLSSLKRAIQPEGYLVRALEKLGYDTSNIGEKFGKEYNDYTIQATFIRRRDGDCKPYLEEETYSVDVAVRQKHPRRKYGVKSYWITKTGRVYSPKGLVTKVMELNRWSIAYMDTYNEIVELANKKVEELAKLYPKAKVKLFQKGKYNRSTRQIYYLVQVEATFENGSRIRIEDWTGDEWRIAEYVDNSTDDYTINQWMQKFTKDNE